MLNNIKNLFRSEQQMKLFFLLSVSTLFCFLLFAFRLNCIGFDLQKIQTVEDLMKYSGHSFFFLNWNLFLAWVPYLISLSVPFLFRIFNSKIIIAFVLLGWLLFFPNAPYIITDLLHIKKRAFIPMWYDVMMIVTFAWTGLMLGYLSLFEIQIFLRKFYSRLTVGVFSVSAIFLCGFGIYLGRFQRWNSWDIISDPLSLLTDIMHTLFHPLIYMRTLGLALVISMFLLLGYLTVLTLSNER